MNVKKKGEKTFTTTRVRSSPGGWKILTRTGRSCICNFNEGLLDGLWTWWHTNGNKMGEANWKEGNLGLVTSWYKNGKKERVGNWKDGKVISFEVWRQNGETCPVTNVKDGNGVLAWYDFELWPEGGRLTYKDGERVC